MKLRLKQRFEKWVRRKTDNDEIFNLLFLLLLGKWFLPTMILWLLPLSLGTQGIQISPEQNQQISKTILETLIGHVENMNQIGIGMSGTIAGYILNVFIMALPYLTLMVMIGVLTCLIRQTLRTFWVKKK